MFQYLYWMLVASVSIGITAIFSAIIDTEMQVGAYFVAAWFHVALSVFLTSIFKNKKAINMVSLALLLVGFAVPITFAFLERSKQNEQIYSAFKCIPVFFFTGSVTDNELQVGCIISAVLMVLAAYLASLFAGVYDGMYADAKVNYLYFLTVKFWQKGVVALPAYDLSKENITDDGDSFSSNGGGGTGSNVGTGLVFRNCVKRFGAGFNLKTCKKSGEPDKVIGPLTVQLQPGKITTLLGPNGVGKSTLMKVAAGYFVPTEGEMILNNVNTFRESPQLCLKSISFCPQDNYLYENMTVEEHMILMSSFRDMSSVENVKTHIDWILQTLDIYDKKSTVAKNLSGGMKRRLCLAISTLGFPSVLLCDEPSSGVDSINQRGIWKLLETMKKKSAILLTSHSALEAVILSDSVIKMESSEIISQTVGVEGLALSIKNDTENVTTEYDVNVDNAEEVANIISLLPNDGTEWKIASKRLNGDVLPPLADVLNRNEDAAEELEGAVSQATDEVPETLNCEAPNTLRQIVTIMSTMLLHPDRIFFLVVFAGGINGALIWLVTQFQGWQETVQHIILPFFPMIGFLCSTIIVCQITEILATERSLGVTKLLLAQGISRYAYLLAYVLAYFLLSYPTTLAILIVVGSIYGTPAGLFSIFVIYSSFQFILTGVCCGLGAVLDARTALISTFILPSAFAIFGQGTTSQTFADSYPGANGQVIAGLLIDHVDKTEWTMFAVSIIVNILIGAIGFYIFLVRLGNYNPFSNIRCKKETQAKVHYRGEEDIENFSRENMNILLEGKNIDKTYGVGVEGNASFKALDSVNFAVERGSLLGLVGKSGAGKSTLMDILSGQTSVTNGAVYVEGKEVVPSDISKVVSLCGQLDTMWPKLKVSSAIAIFMLCRGYKGNLYCSNTISDPYISHLIKELGLEETLKKNVEKLSGGQKRRLAFLMSLMGNTKVVLVDEAMTGVDNESRQIMWKILQDEVRLRDRSVVVTSHEMSEVEQYCNTIGILHQGQLVDFGQLDEIKKKWGDSIKLICLFSSYDLVAEVNNIISEKLPEIAVELPDIDILDEPEGTRIVATYAVDLVDLKNIAGLICTMEEDVSDPSMLYWSIEPQSLDDFVRSKSKTEVEYDE